MHDVARWPVARLVHRPNADVIDVKALNRSPAEVTGEAEQAIVQAHGRSGVTSSDLLFTG